VGDDVNDLPLVRGAALGAAMANACPAVLEAANHQAGFILGDRRIWSINSTLTGGGVAEMLQSLVSYARGASVDLKLFRAVLIDLAQPSIFLNLRQGARFHVGPMAPMPSHRQLVRCWGGEWPFASLFVPIRLQNRMVAVLYGDRGAAGVSDVSIEELAALAQKGAEAFELCILRKKLQSN